LNRKGGQKSRCQPRRGPGLAILFVVIAIRLPWNQAVPKEVENMNGKFVLSVILGVTLMASIAWAGNEEAYLGLLRSDVRAEKVAVIDEVMEFSDEEAASFWPVYREYDRQLSMIVDDRIAMIRNFAEQYGTFDDKKSRKMAEKSLRLESRRTNLKRKFFPRFEKAVGAKRAAQFFQLEHQINLLVELQISSELPLID
jgi:hypothetical protein